jgi:hypothetical protein
VVCVGLGYHLAELRHGADQIALDALRHTEAPAALTRIEPVADRIGEVATFFGGRARRDRVTLQDRPERLPAEDLAQPPPIA